MFFLALPISALIVLVYLAHEAWENYTEERRVAFWLDLLFMLPCAVILALYIPGVFSAVLHWLA